MSKITEQVRERYNILLWQRNITQNAVRQPKLDALRMEEAMTACEDGIYFSDVDYEGQSRALWGAEYHYGHMLQIILANGRERLLNDTVYAGKLVDALRFWIARDFHNPNWWHNEIGVPENLADVTNLLYSVLPKDVLDGVAKIIDRGSLTGNPKVTERTGANLVWGGSVSMRLAALTGNEPLLALAAERTASELSCGEEGIQTDGSFFQHGPRLYSGGYGRSFAYNVAQMIYVLDGTPYQFPQERLACYATHVLDGLRNLSCRDALDYQCVGREYTRPGAIGMGILIRAVSILADTEGMPRRAEFTEYLAEINGRTPADRTKYFPVGGLLTHTTDGLYVGTKILSEKLLDEEICNDEGILGYNLSYGTHTCAMTTGREYFNLAPYWYYDRMPGTTARRETDEQLLAKNTAWARRRIPAGQSGGFQKGKYAVVWQRADHETVHALTASFAFPHGFVRLACDISDSENAPLYTTVEQSRLTGAFGREGNSYTANGIRYTPLDGTEFVCEMLSRSGNWHRNSLPEAKTYQRPILLYSLTVPHKGGETAKCAYMLSAVNVPAPKVEVLRNDTEMQSVRADGVTLTVDYRTGEISVQE